MSRAAFIATAQLLIIAQSPRVGMDTLAASSICKFFVASKEDVALSYIRVRKVKGVWRAQICRRSQMICDAKHPHTAGYTIAYPEELLIGIDE